MPKKSSFIVLKFHKKSFILGKKGGIYEKVSNSADFGGGGNVESSQERDLH